jgi:arylsulfatase A-like enzyme
LMAAGPDVPRGTLPVPVDTVDLAPTILDWMGAPIPTRMEGSPLEALRGGGSRASV